MIIKPFWHWPSNFEQICRNDDNTFYGVHRKVSRWGYTVRHTYYAPSLESHLVDFEWFTVVDSIFRCIWSMRQCVKQACQRSKVVQKGPKGSKMVNLSVFDHLGPFWAHLDPFGPFQTKMNFLPQMGVAEVLRSKKSIFVWNGPKGSRWAQKGPKWSKTLRLTILDPFGPLWNVDKPAMFGHFWSKMDHFWAFPSHEQ